MAITFSGFSVVPSYQTRSAFQMHKSRNCDQIKKGGLFFTFAAKPLASPASKLFFFTWNSSAIVKRPISLVWILSTSHPTLLLKVSPKLLHLALMLLNKKTSGCNERSGLRSQHHARQAALGGGKHTKFNFFYSLA